MSKTSITHRMVDGKRRETPTYTSWRRMRSRCCRRNDPDYRLYGGRGIAVCDRWKTFKNFLSDMGERPLGKTLERIDSNSNYNPKNCRWATRTDQANNCRNNHKITHGGLTLGISQWESLLGFGKRRLVKARLALGWTMDEIASTPPGVRKPKRTINGQFAPTDTRPGPLATSNP